MDILMVTQLLSTWRFQILGGTFMDRSMLHDATGDSSTTCIQKSAHG